MSGANDDERLTLIPAKYHAPMGVFDEAASGKPAPQRLLEIEDGKLRMATVRNTFALQTSQFSCLCGTAALGQILTEQGIVLPGFVAPVALGISLLVLIALWLKQTRYPVNFVLVWCFTCCIAAFLAVSVASHGNHSIANAIVQVAIGNALMLLYSLPTFCCDLRIFDIRYYGLVGYIAMLLIAAGGNVFVNIIVYNEKHALPRIILTFVWNLGTLWAVRGALTKFREGHITAVFAETLVWPISMSYIYLQKVGRVRANATK